MEPTERWKYLENIKWQNSEYQQLMSLNEKVERKKFSAARYSTMAGKFTRLINATVIRLERAKYEPMHKVERGAYINSLNRRLEKLLDKQEEVFRWYSGKNSY